MKAKLYSIFVTLFVGYIVNSDWFVLGDIEGVVRNWNMKRFRMW